MLVRRTHLMPSRWGVDYVQFSLKKFAPKIVSFDTIFVVLIFLNSDFKSTIIDHFLALYGG